jgi:DNA polymerase III sliding clamp (beta) subunit (PCNA family)
MTKFTVSRPVLTTLASRAGSVVPSSAGYSSSAQNLRIEAEPGLLRLTGTDMELTVVTSTPVVQVEEPGEILVSASQAAGFLREAAGDEVVVSTFTDAKKRPLVRLASGGQHTDLIREAVTFPAIPEIPAGAWNKVDREHLVSAIRTVRHAVSKNGSYPAWACVTIIPDPEKATVAVMASDMARAQFAAIPPVVTDGKAVAGFPFACTIPAAGGAVSEVLKVLGAVDLPDAEVAQTESAIGFRVGSTTIMVARMHARPADVLRKLTKATVKNTVKLHVDRDALAAAVRGARVTADETTPVIGLRCEGDKVTVLSQNKRQERSQKVIAAKWGEEDERLLLVNATFLTDMLAVHPSGSCEFLVAPASEGKKRAESDILLRDEVSGITGIIPQMANEAARLGYE